MDSSTEIRAWSLAARQGKPAAYKTVTLELQAADGSVVQRYLLVNAFPSKLEIGGMKAGTAQQVVQIVTLTCDEIIRAS